MKIGSTPDHLAAFDVANRPGAKPAAPPRLDGGHSADRVALSAAGARMGGISSESDFDSAKVDAIRNAIRDGRFSVNPEAIADRLIADAVSLLGARSV